MDTAELQAFITVAQTGSFSQAADRLFLTQPAVSKRISTLESQLETRLFDRIGRGVSLTEAGSALLPRAKRIMLELEDSRRIISNLSGRVAGSLSIGTSHHIGLHRLPPVLRTFMAKYTDVKLDLRFMDSEVACRAVLQGDLELGIVTLPLQPVAKLVMEKIWDDPLNIVMSKQHALASHKTISLKMLTQHPTILPARGTYTRELLEKTFRPLVPELQVSFSTNYLETIKMMVQVGLAWSVLPDSMIDSNTFRIVRVKGLKLNRSLGVIHHASRTLSNAGSAMIDVLKKCK